MVRLSDQADAKRHPQLLDRQDNIETRQGAAAHFVGAKFPEVFRFMVPGDDVLKSGGGAVRTWLKAVRPPADAAIATTSKAAFGK